MISDDSELLEILIHDWKNSNSYDEIQGDNNSFYNQFVEDLKARPLSENINRSIRGLTAVSGCDHNQTACEIKHFKVNDLSGEEKRPLVDASITQLLTG